ncbi:unnamed protein product [Ectocarpus fasciculatus]
MDDVLDGTADNDNKKHNTDEVDEMADKLDGVMLVVFNYLDQRLTANASLPPETILETPVAGEGGCEAAAAAQAVLRGDEAGSDSGTLTGPGGMQGMMQQGMEPVARLLKSLLLVFEENILPTHRSKFVQFVLFFASGRARGLGYALVSKLVGVLRDESRPKLTRQSSVAYLASFLARASFVDPSLVSTAVQSLLDWAGQYLDQHVDASTAAAAATAATVQAVGTPTSKGFETPVATRVRARPQSWHGNHPRRIANGGGGMMQAPMSAVSSRSGAGGSGGVGVNGSSSKSRPADHMLFYSVCQATFYVMCFRGDELAAMEGFESQAAIWQRLLTCPLYPLRRCLDTVRREFARLCCGLMDAYLDRDLLEHLAGISEERSQVSQTITVGSSFSCSTPRSSSSMSMSMSNSAMWTPSRVTKAGGLGRGSNPLDSFFPFDPYLLRRSHVYIDEMYNTWKAQDDSSRHHRTTKSSGARTAAGTGDSEDSSVTSDSSDDESSSSEDDDDRNNNDHMDASSMSFRDGAGGLRARSRRERKEAAKKKKSKAKSRLAKNRSEGGSSEEEEEDDESRRMSRKMADTYITESMSVTPASSVAVGSLMGRSLGQAMSSSFADDGLVWGTGAGGAAGTPDDAFFHENVSPCPSPPLAESAISGRSRPLDIGVRSKRALF